MKKILILCEGVTDQVFIADCLQIFYQIEFTEFCKLRDDLQKASEQENSKNIKKAQEALKKDLPIIGFKKNFDFTIEIRAIYGCKKLRTDINIDAMKDNIEEQGENIVIFDADDEAHIDEAGKDISGNGNNGFENAKTSLQNLQNSVDFGFYLWPNNKDNGDVEILLRQLIPTNKEPVMQCIEQHQKCLKKTNIEGLRYADLKKMLTFYLYTNSIDQTEGRNRDYTNTDFWNLNPKQNENLQELKDFLDKYFL